jgi:hypothetical protein
MVHKRLTWIALVTSAGSRRQRSAPALTPAQQKVLGSFRERAR